MTDTSTVVALLDADRPVPMQYRSVTPTLILRCKEKQFEIYVTFNGVVDDDSPNRIRFDSGEVIEDPDWTTGTGLDSLFTSEPVDFAASLVGPRQLRFGFIPYGLGEQVAIFTLTGVRNILPRLQKECAHVPLPAEVDKAKAAAAQRPKVTSPWPGATNLSVPMKTKDVRPVYPEAARQGRVQGIVTVEIMTAPDGTVREARIVRSIPLLDEAALDAVRQWQFTPTVFNSVAISVTFEASVPFTLP